MWFLTLLIYLREMLYTAFFILFLLYFVNVALSKPLDFLFYFLNNFYSTTLAKYDKKIKK
jgi:hypothetical protein